MAYFTSEKFHIVKATLNQHGFESGSTTEYMAREGCQLGSGRIIGRLLVFEKLGCRDVYMLNCVPGFGVTSKFAEIVQNLGEDKSPTVTLG